MGFASLTATLLLGWAVYSAIHRLFLSPLARIPGPKLAALTSWYEFYYDVVQPGKFVWKINELHEQYGPIVRINPREIHIKDVSFLDNIYAPPLRRRDKDTFQLQTFPLTMSLGGTADHYIHKRRREALNPFFNKKSVMSLEPMICQKVELLCRLLDRYMEHKYPVNLSNACYAMANDVVSRYSFGKDDDLLSDEVRAATLRENQTRLLSGIKFSAHFPWIVAGMNKLPTSVSKHLAPPGVIDMIDFSSQIRAEIQQVFDDKEDNAEQGDKRSIFPELRDTPDLPPSEKSLTRLEHEGTLLIMAGSESTAKSILVTHFHLLHKPALMAKVRAELRTVSSSASWSELEQLPYLSACIAEGNRLSFGVTQRMCRIAPDETLHYNGYTIPPGTPVSSTTLCVHTDESVFQEPWAFIPERWLGPEGAGRRKYQMAFGKGGRKCIGINLAHAELFLTIAALARYDMELWETDESDVEFRHDYQVAHPKPDSKGFRVKVLGKVEMH